MDPSFLGPDNLQTLPMEETEWSKIVASAAASVKFSPKWPSPGSPQSSKREVEQPEEEKEEEPNMEVQVKELTDKTKEDLNMEKEENPEEEKGPELEKNLDDKKEKAGRNEKKVKKVKELNEEKKKVKETRKDEDVEDVESEAQAVEKYPIMKREDQQAFKDSRGKVQKMDQPDAKANGKGTKPKQTQKPAPSRKRPAASTERETRTKTPKLASPVVPVDDVPEEVQSSCSEIPPLNLSPAFDAVADEETPKDSRKPRQKDTKKGKEKSPAKTPKAKAMKKKGEKTPKTPKAKAKAKGKKPEKTPKTPKAKAKAKGKRSEKKDKKTEDSQEEQEGKKATFAGRRVPKTGEAHNRFLALRTTLETKIQPHVVKQVSNAEVFGWG